MRLLAGDIGGTKTTLAVIDLVDGKPIEVVSQQYPSGEYSRFDLIIDDFLRCHEFDLDAAGFGIAGPVISGQCRTTNLPWMVDRLELKKQLNLDNTGLINDLEANAWGVRALEKTDFLVLNEGEPSRNANAAMISAGTGLGVAGMVWDGQICRPFASEGGHVDFAPTSDLDIALFEFLRDRYGHVSWERVVSGMGIANIYDFLLGYRQQSTPEWLQLEMDAGDRVAAISQAALSSRCQVCEETLEVFARLYGAQAGNFALCMMASSGVYIGGGIAPKILSLLKKPTFMEAFVDKGRMRPLMEKMPVRVILNDRAALFGAALYAGRDQ